MGEVGQGMTGNSLRPFGITPLVMATIICSWSTRRGPFPCRGSGCRRRIADARNPESDLRARERALRVSLAEKSAGV